MQDKFTARHPAAAQMMTFVLLNYSQQCRQTAASSHSLVPVVTEAAASEPTSDIHTWIHKLAIPTVSIVNTLLRTVSTDS